MFSLSVQTAVRQWAVWRQLSEANVERYPPPHDAPSCLNLEKHSAYSFAVQSESPGGRTTSPRGAERNFRAFVTVFSLNVQSVVKTVGGLPAVL